MNEKLPIRPLAKQGESLSGYIMRTARLLDIDPKHLLKHIYNKHNFYYPGITNETALQYFKIAFSLDILPFRFLNKTGFCAMIDKTSEEIEKMTFSNLFAKFNYPYSIDQSKYGAVLSNKIINDFRRFCPICLKEEGIYKLLWQIKEIEVCDIHKIKLKYTCPKCQSKQKYYSKELAEYRCYKCGHLLWDNEQYNEPYNEGLKYYDDWRFLLDSKTVICKQIAGIDKERSLAIVCLYLIQNQENIKFFHTRTVRDIIRFIKGEGEGRKATFPAVLKILRKKNISLKEFSDIIVPEIYVDSLLEVNYPINKNGVCLSPWCRHLNSDTMIRSVKVKAFSKGFINKSVCLGCFMLYGYSRTSNCWENIDKNISDNIIIVRGLLLVNMSKKDIKLKLSISVHLIDKIIGYLLNYKPLQESYNVKYIPKVIDNDILEKFKHLISLEGESCRKAKKVYGWSYIQYHYYFWLPQVQKQLYFDKEVSELAPKRIEIIKICDWKQILANAIEYLWVNDIDIGWSNLERYFSLSWKNLKQNNLIEIVVQANKLQKYRRSLEYNMKVRKQVTQYISEYSYVKLTLAKLCNDLEISMTSIRRRSKGIKLWIDIQIHQYNQNSLYKIHEGYKQQIKFIILERYKEGISSSIYSVSLKLGRGKNYIERYPELKQYTSKIIDKYNSG